MKRAFKLTLRTRKRTDKVFDPELGPGVLAFRELEVDLPEGYSPAMAARWLLDAQEDFLRDCVEVVAEEIG